MNPLRYLWAYFETNHFTAYLVVFLVALSFIKYLKFPPLPVKKTLFVILLLGLALRVGWFCFSSYEPKPEWNSTSMMESDVINVQALELTKGVWFHEPDGQSSARRPIGYPIVLAAVYKIFGPHQVAANILNLTLFVLGAWLVFLIGSLIFSDRVGLLSAFFYSIYPVSIYSIRLMTDEHLFIPLWFLGLYFLLREIKGSPVRWPILWYGLIFGFAAMTRTHVIFMPFVVAATYFLLKYSWKKIIFSFLAIVFLMQLVNLPWVIRNYKVWGVPVLYTASSSYIYRSFNSSATPEGGGHIPVKGEEGYSEELETALHSGNGAIYNKLCGDEINKWILNHPKDFLLLGTCRAIYFMGWDRTGGMWPIWLQFQEGSYDPKRPPAQALKDFFEEAAYASYYIILFCFLFGCVFLLRRWKSFSRDTRISIFMLASCFLFWLLEHMIIYPDRKYRFPLEPLMIITGSFFLSWLLCEFRPIRGAKQHA